MCVNTICIQTHKFHMFFLFFSFTISFGLVLLLVLIRLLSYIFNLTSLDVILFINLLLDLFKTAFSELTNLILKIQCSFLITLCFVSWGK